jgi:hypothetical protein
MIGEVALHAVSLLIFMVNASRHGKGVLLWDRIRLISCEFDEIHQVASASFTGSLKVG